MLRENLVSGSDEAEEVMMTSNESDVVKAMGEETDPTENWDLSKVWVYTDPTGIKVPVPYGFTASGAESERYVTGNVEKKGTLSNLTFTSSGDYPWTLNDDNIWVSGNKGITDSVSELISNEITVGENGGYVSVEWSVSSQSGYDVLSMEINDTTNGTSEKMLKEISGKPYGTEESSLIYTKYGKELATGTYTISVKYTKYNNTTHRYLDSGYVKGGTYFEYDENGADEETIHKTGGMVIYEGTDEVNDSNAWDESLTRNQFVWVPIADINDIVCTDAASHKSKFYIYSINKSETRKVEPDGFGDISGPAPRICSEYPNLYRYYSFGRIITGNFWSYVTGIAKFQSCDLQLKSEVENLYSIAYSVEKYGGFYIGRYETGYINSNYTTKRFNDGCGTTLKWYESLHKSENVCISNNVKTTGCYDELISYVFKWLLDEQEVTNGELVIDPVGKGNFYNMGFDYYDINKNILHKDCERRETIPTGSGDSFALLNIYDLLGNYPDTGRDACGDGDNTYFTRGSWMLYLTSWGDTYQRDTQSYYGLRGQCQVRGSKSTTTTRPAPRLMLWID